MFVVRLLLFSVLLYNTEALPTANDVGDYSYDYLDPTVSNTSIGTNGSESFAVENNYTYSVPPGEANKTTILPVSESLHDYYDKLTNHTETNDSPSVTTEREFFRNKTTTPDFWYNRTPEVSETFTTRISYDSYWGKLFHPNTTTTPTPDSWYNRTAEVSETTTAKIPHDRYSGRVGYITLENGMLTAHLPETSSAEEKTTTDAATTPKRPNEWWSYKYGTTTPVTPYYVYPYYDWYKQNANTEATATPKRPNDWWSYKYGTTTPVTLYYKYPYYEWNKQTTTETATTPKRPNDWWPYRYGITSTTRRPYYNQYYGSYRPYWPKIIEPTYSLSYTTTPDYWPDKTDEAPKTTTTRKPYDWLNIGLREYFRNVTTPYFWYNETSEDSETELTTTTGAYRYTWPQWHPRSTTGAYRYTWPQWDPTSTTGAYRNTWPRWDPRSTTGAYQYNTDETTDTTDQAHRTTPATTCKSCNPVNISNSTINTGDKGIYEKLIDLLKGIARNILPSTISLAPNSNVTNLAVATGNENMFIFVNK